MSEIKRLRKMADKISSKMENMQRLTDSELKGKTDEFKLRLKNGETVDQIMPDAYAAVGEAAYRSIGLRPYKVQIMGAIALNEGKIAEQKTGEGKTLTASMPAYLNALEGKGVHIVTVNDYLAERDAEDIGRIHRFMGLTVGCILKTTSPEEKKKEYAKDITYITNTELGFDYLRDNMAQRMEDKMQRGFHFCIIDEVDSVLIDEARTPLIVSGNSGKSTKLYIACNELAKQLEKGEVTELSKVDLMAGERPEETGDYTVDEEHRIVTLTLQGIKKCEKYFGIDNLADREYTELYHNILAALKAHNLMKKDKDYVVKNGEVLIVDSFTGRIQPGRRYSDGLHQALEAKEGVEVKEETSTYATVTYQNFFNKYDKKCGMTGTASTERKEFKDIYHMSVVKIPTNKPVQRIDDSDKMFLTRQSKFKAVVDEIKKTHETGQPILVGTSTIQDSEILDKMLKEEGLPHTVLNAKFLEKEAEIIAKAGTKGSITIATNMAGRGTDIKLDDDAKAAGGLKVIGTQRHESRRIDNQLKGRSGRQGDPGCTQFCISMEDELMRLFGGERMQAIVKRLGVEEDEAIEARAITKQIENAQKKVEGRNFSIRKYVLQYDNVMNKQREIIYSERKRVLFGEDLREYLVSMTHQLIDEVVDPVVIASKFPEEWDFETINKGLAKITPAFEPLDFDEEVLHDMDEQSLKNGLYEDFEDLYKAKEEEIGIDKIREIERMILIRVVDNKWMDHIDDMEQLKSGIGLRGLGGQDPAAAYAQEGFDMFELMVNSIKEEFVKFCYNVTVQTTTERKNVMGYGEGHKDEFSEEQYLEAAGEGEMPDGAVIPEREHKQETFRREQPKVGRNDPCPCGSGKKFKHCCGRNE